MLDNGYSLERVELLNWGNFHGYQKFSLREGDETTPLFAPKPASAILGINGSGKSTLIDAVMIALLPFEGSVKLGVTNDVEAGAGGGRTIRDYVLGKHSSSGAANADLESIFGRKDGCSFVLLRFAHNKRAGRVLSLGRVWWYHNYKVSDTQLAFLSYEKLSLTDLCPGGKTPPTAKLFRAHVKNAACKVQVFETMQAYFSAMSQALGRISRDDLKILNRAFFVKSISNIDAFIRENMLVEQESPSLDRLMDNVRNGQEIALSIETCEAKIASIARILREVGKLCELNRTAQALVRRQRLLGLHKDWKDLRDGLRQRQDLARGILELETRLPLIRRDAEVATEQAKSAQARLLNDDIEARVIALDQEIRLVVEQVAWKRQTYDRWCNRAQACALKFPKSIGALEPWLHDSQKAAEIDRHRAKQLGEEIEVARDAKFSIEKEATDLREELKHFSENKTLISRELHAIKQAAQKSNKIKAHDLVFVGELIQVKREFSQYRRAIESVLYPISRNLLCHPDSLHEFTRWLDSEGLRSDITAKRIRPEELESSSSPDRGRDDVNVVDGADGGILDMVDVRTDTPFTTYLWRWLRDSFDYAVVDLRKFKSEDGRLVTKEGLVKKDTRTMRKLKREFSFSLGWDNTDVVEILSARLVLLNTKRTASATEIERKLEEQASIEDRVRLVAEIRNDFDVVVGLTADTTRLSDLEVSRVALLEMNPDHQRLRQEANALEERAHGLTRNLLTLESNHKANEEIVRKLDGLLPLREKELKDSKIYLDLLVDLEREEALESALTEIDDLLFKRGISRLQLEGELNIEFRQLELARGRATSNAANFLGQYRHQFNDPDLAYDLAGNQSLDALHAEWSATERRLKDTDLPNAQDKWKRFFDQILLDSVKDMVNEIKSRLHETEETIASINDVLKLTNFEDLIDEKRYLRIDAQAAPDERIRKFRKSMTEVEKTLGPAMRAHVESQSQTVMSVLVPFVEEFQKDPAYRAHVTDVRNHFLFSVQSLRRELAGSDTVVETFSGARRDAKSSAQTTQLAYALLASCLAFRFRFHDPIGGAETPRLIILDEFGGKFDNEKPREIVKLLEKMGFQSVLVSPMSKADLLADSISQLVLVHKVSATKSKVRSYHLSSREDYERLLTLAAQAEFPAVAPLASETSAVVL